MIEQEDIVCASTMADGKKHKKNANLSVNGRILHCNDFFAVMVFEAAVVNVCGEIPDGGLELMLVPCSFRALSCEFGRTIYHMILLQCGSVL